MSRRAVAVRVLLLLASVAFVSAPLLDVCHHPAGHHGHHHPHEAPVSHVHHGHTDASEASASPALGVEHSSTAQPHESDLACSGVAALERRPEPLLGAITAFDAIGSATVASRLALGPTTPPP